MPLNGNLRKNYAASQSNENRKFKASFVCVCLCVCVLASSLTHILSLIDFAVTDAKMDFFLIKTRIHPFFFFLFESPFSSFSGPFGCTSQDRFAKADSSITPHFNNDKEE